MAIGARTINWPQCLCHQKVEIICHTEMLLILAISEGHIKFKYMFRTSISTAIRFHKEHSNMWIFQLFLGKWIY